MKICEYESVFNDDNPQDEPAENHDTSWRPFLRQLQISSCVWSMYFQFGLCIGATTVIIAHMRDERGEQYVTQDMASWISSAIMYAGIPWAPVIVFLAYAIGRRYTFALGTITSLVGFAVLSVGDTPLQVLAGMIVQGPLPAFTNSMTMLVLTEYTSPLYRGVFLTIKSATAFWGIWVANAIGTMTHWHYIMWLGVVCAVYNLVSVFAWPESPYWLASMGRLEQCRKVLRWLKGPSIEKELRELIEGNQPDNIEKYEFSENKQKKNFTEKCRQVCLGMKSKCFYKSLLFNMALCCQYQLMGKIVFSVYAIDIIKDITKSKHEAYKGMLILDGVTVLGMYVGCGLSKRLTRRMLLISAGGAGSAFMFIMSVYLFLVRFEMISENNYITVSLLICYSLSVSCGPIILNSTLGAELLPLRLRCTAALTVAMGNVFLLGTNIKVAPYIFSNFGMDGACLFYALTSSSFLFILYLYLPETKDKSLNEIQELIVGTRTKCVPEPLEMKEYISLKLKKRSSLEQLKSKT